MLCNVYVEDSQNIAFAVLPEDRCNSFIKLSTLFNIAIPEWWIFKVIDYLDSHFHLTKDRTGITSQQIWQLFQYSDGLHLPLSWIKDVIWLEFGFWHLQLCIALDILHTSTTKIER